MEARVLRGAAFAFALLALVGMSQVACGSSGGGGTHASAPTPQVTLTYPVNPATGTKGAAITPLAPQVTGGTLTDYAVAPALPSGLTLDSATGVIAGTPSVLSPQTAYAVSAGKAGARVTCYVLLAVIDLPPQGLGYGAASATWTKGQAIAPLTPGVSGGAVVRYSVSPALPEGITLDAPTGLISGTPSVVTAGATYHVTASNSGGSVTTDLLLAVNDVRPSALTYGTNPATWVAGVEIMPDRPSHQGGDVVSYQVAPALPTGLVLDPATGVITGTPTRSQARATYTVTARNSGGGTLCDLSIAVNDPAPTQLTYADAAPVYTRGQAIPANYPSHLGGSVTDYRITPALPAGLSLDPVTGALTGTPTAVQALTSYTVTAANSGGSTTCSLALTVREAAPTNLTYATNPTAYALGTAIQPNVPSHGGGAVSSYAVSPGLPAGLSLDPSTGVISGTPTALTPQATYVVTASNATGATTCAFVTSVVPSAVAPPAVPAVTASSPVTTGQTGLQASTQDQGTANGTTYLWTVTGGTLTAGQGTPTITYTAGAPGTLTLSVKVSNLGGSATGSRDVAILAVPVAQLFAQPKVLRGTRVRASVAPQAGMTTTWTLSGTGAGTFLSNTGNVASYLAGPTPGTYQLGVTVQSPVGSSAAASRTLEVVAGQFLPDAQTGRQRMAHTLTVLQDGRLLLAGGDPNHASTVPTAEIYDPHSGTWMPTGPMTSFRNYHAAALLPDGKVLVSGGVLPSSVILDSTEIYDPATNAWTPGPTLNATRQQHTATALADGTVLIAGGFGLDSGGAQGGYLASAEIFDPASQSTMVVAPMSSPRASHTATRLQNGLVLVVAGAKGTNVGGWLSSAEVFDPVLQTWSTVGSLATARQDHTATLLPNGKVFVAAGQGVSGPLDGGELFNPATGTWSTTANKMASGHTAHAAALLPSGRVLVVGGSAGTAGAEVESYDPTTNRWTPVQPLLTGRSRAVAALLPSGQVLVAGGQGNNTQVIANPELYDPTLGTWSTQGIADSSRFGHTSTLLADGTLLVAGGSGAVAYITSAEKYDPATATWSAAASLAKGRVYHTASRMADGSVIVVGGLGIGGLELAHAERYVPATDTWSTLVTPASARTNHTATVLTDGRLLVVGGKIGATTLTSAELYDPATGLWSPAGSLATARYDHTATLLPSGKVLVAGGGTSATFHASAELYDPATNAWTPVAAMISARMGHTATLLPDGSVLMMGGQRDFNGGLGTVERYFPATNTWSAQASMNGQRYNHSACLLPDGRVLVTGGRNTSFQTDGTGELYDPAAQTSTSLPLAGVRAYHTSTVLDAAGTVLLLGGSPAVTPEFFKP
ncbi:MAG TPA: kelch repeat-containing protein [Holophagaceae bacterium]|nr:kelch repeat-containing protein [Holophagaceae bacterium]